MGSHPEKNSYFNKKEISFKVNGKYQIIKDEYPLETSLNFYLRNVLKLTGTKVFCEEGGCGCCVVNASKFDLISNKFQEFSINSCLTLLYTCDGYSFTTVEGIGNKKTGLHPIQKRLADCNGSQCGFCSPGFVMSMYSSLKCNPKQSKQEIEKSLDGNICRCTGYRSILDAMKSFSIEENPIFDIEDLTINNLNCLNQSANNEMHCISRDNKEWYSPKSLDDLKRILRANRNKKFRFICGNTSIGVYKKSGPFDCYLNIKNVKELYLIEKCENKIKIGSNCTLTQLRDIFKNISKDFKNKFEHLKEISKDLEKIANVHVRNVASWAGNLIIKKEHLEFASDVFVLLEAIGARLNIFNFENQSYLEEISLKDFLERKDLIANKFLIESMSIRGMEQEKIEIKYFKVSPRSQNSHAYINSAFRFQFESSNSTILTSKPLIIFNGITENFLNASQTEEYLENKDLNDPLIVKKSIEILLNELNSSGIHQIQNVLLASSNYRVSLAVSMFYKFILSVNMNKSKQLSSEIQSALESLVDCRQISKGEQIFEKSKEQLHPVTKPMPKLSSYSQTCGETKYVDDLSLLSLQTHAAFIKSTVASAKIDSIDIQKALNLPGVIAVYLAKDIPGENNFMTKEFSKEQVFAEKEVIYCGQPIGIVVAETHEIAKKASYLVKVNYSEVKKPILNIYDAIEQNSFHSKPSCGDLIKGNPLEAIQNSKHQISGEIFIDSSQFNFYLEGITCQCEPTDDGYKLEVTSQWLESVHSSVAQVLGIQNSSCIDVQCKQIGGGFGGKITRPNLIACACALASKHLNKPVKIRLDLNDCLEMFGRRPTWFVKYKVGFEQNGKLNSIIYDWFADMGVSPNNSLMFYCLHFFDNCYKIPNAIVRLNLVKTNKPAGIEVRSPDLFTCYSIGEQVMETIAEYLKMDSLKLREINFFQKGDSTASGHLLSSIEIEKLVEDLKESSNFLNRKLKCEEFNNQNKYKKKGIFLMPLRYSLTHAYCYFNALVSIRHDDGSVSVSHGGIEMGQGIHTKVAQVCAYELGIPLDMVSIKSTNSLINPNGLWTGASITAELCCKSVIGACRILKERLESVRKLMPDGYKWKELIAKAFLMNTNLSAMFLVKPQENLKDILAYDLDAAACSEVLVDVLTGEIQILRTDILYDCGQTMNGLIDVGQAEGGFVMGLGYMLLEKTIYDPETGKCLNNGTWEYKPPMTGDIPIDFRIKFLENKPNPVGVLGSKATGEPPLILSNSIYFAIRQAVASARQDRNVNAHFRLDLPATVENIQQACLVEPNEFYL